MPELSSERIRAYLRDGDEAETTAQKGHALEDLICYVFGSVPGITVTKRNALNTFDTEEIDVAFWNEPGPNGLVNLPPIILVECKNWSAPVGSAEVAWFDRKLQDRGLDFGVLVAAQGITGDATNRTAAHQIVAGLLRDGRRLIVYRREELEALTNTDQVVATVKEKLCELVVNGTVFP